MLTESGRQPGITLILRRFRLRGDPSIPHTQAENIPCGRVICILLYNPSYTCLLCAAAPVRDIKEKTAVGVRTPTAVYYHIHNNMNKSNIVMQGYRVTGCSVYMHEFYPSQTVKW